MAVSKYRWKEEDLIKAIEEVYRTDIHRYEKQLRSMASQIAHYLTHKVEIGTRPGPDPVHGKDIEAQVVECMGH